MMRAPLAPNGCPMAMAPPLTLVLVRSAPVSLAQASVGLGVLMFPRGRRDPDLGIPQLCGRVVGRGARAGMSFGHNR
jgi:hypothetical protein